ncbi:exocyst complex component 1-like [Protopterus annectens]|uniref:exocyst complex component 1-like n=1 Tax=Protopterus annectens TaxID=7888 RepID=UPI001CF9CBA9|nr:exocyst complex component 1-like [Protopterus annectens]
MMTTVRKKLVQDNVFRPKGDKLLHILSLSKSSSQKEDSYLCISVTREKEVQISHLQIRRMGTTDMYERLKVWHLKDLVLVDGRDAMEDNPHFDMHFSDVCSWEAFSTASKYEFARCLRKMSKTYYKKDLRFIHFDNDFIEDVRHYEVPEDTMLVLKMCLQAFNCVCLLGCL